MHPLAIQNVSLWLDDRFSQDIAFGQAICWAECLDLPIRVVAKWWKKSGGAAPWLSGDRRGFRQPTVEPAKLAEIHRKWASACGQAGVSVQTVLWQGDSEVGIDHFLSPSSLCVVETYGGQRFPQVLLQRSLRNKRTPLLLCGRTCRSLTRPLVLFEYMDPANAFLQNVAQLCVALHANPLVLAVSHQEREAQFRLAYAEGFFASQRVAADFDAMVGCDIPTAINRVALWRDCSHVILERQRPSSGWFQLRGDLLDRLSGASDRLSILALPEATPLTFEHSHGQSRNRQGAEQDALLLQSRL
jgi:hypothetical protein